MALRRTTACQTAKKDALRSLGEGGPNCRFSLKLSSIISTRYPSRSVGQGGAAMHYVYFLQSERFPDQRYIGVTADLKQRIPDHNSGKSSHTSKYVPWKLVTYVAFSDRQKAETF